MATSSTLCTVQHVTKASSDQLLSKFAELESDSATRSPRKLQLINGPIIRRKRSRRVASGLGARDVVTGSAETPSARRRRSGGLAEWKALIPPSSRRSASLLRKMGIGRAEIGTGEAAGIGLLLAALEKAWRKTMEGASKMFIEKHCSTHVRLISDVV